MKKEKLEKLTKAGWSVGSSSDFLNLTPEESALIEGKVAHSEYFHEKRKHAKVSQSRDL